MINIKNTSTIFITLITSMLLSFGAHARFCDTIKTGTKMTSAGGTSINNGHYVVAGGAGAGSSTGNTSTCGDSWHSTPTCPRGYGPSSPSEEEASPACGQLQSDLDCASYALTITGSQETKERCSALQDECEASASSCIDPAPIENPQIISMYERSNGDAHGGIDYAAPYGTPALAPMSGEYKVKGNGSIEVYDTKTNITAVFHHLFCIPSELKSGDYVKKGEIIGWVGNTGQSAAPHMHIGFYSGENRYPSRTGYLNPLANETNSSFCDLPQEACFNEWQTNVEASAQTEQAIRKCNSDDYQTATGGNNVGGSGAGGNSNQSNPSGDTNYTETMLKKNNEECHPSIFMSMFESCLFCDLFKTVYNTISLVAKQAYTTFAKPVINVLTVGFAIWIATKIMPLVSGFKEGKAVGLIMEILKQSLMVFIVVIFLSSNGLGFFTYLMEPIFDTGFRLANTLLVTNEPCKADYGILTQAQGGGLPSSMGNNIMCVIEQLQSSIVTTLASGLTCICIAYFVDPYLGIAAFPDLAYLLTGIVLLIGGIMLISIFAFTVLDSVLQLGVAVSLLPFAMAAFIFKSTKKYATKVWSTFMSVVFNFVFLCLILMVVIKIIDINIADTLRESLATSFVNDNIGDILEVIGWETVLFLKIIFIFILAKVMIEEVGSFASQFSSEGFKLGLAQKAGGLIASGTLNTGKRIFLKPLKSGVKKLGARAATGIMRARTQQKANYQRNYFDKLTKAGFVDKDGVYKSGNVIMKKDKDGNLVRITKKKNKIVTKTYGTDAQGRSTREVETQDLREQKRAQRALKRAKERGIATKNADGSTTYTYAGKLFGLKKLSPREFSVTVAANGDVTRSYFNSITQSGKATTFKNEPSKTVVKESYDQKEYQEYDANGNLIYEHNQGMGNASKNLIKNNGDINRTSINSIKAGQENLKNRLDNETDVNKRKNLEIEIEKEEQRTSKLIGTTVIKNHLSSKYFDDNRGYANQEVTSNGDKISIKETQADGVQRSYNIDMSGKKAILEAESTYNDNSKLLLKTDGVLQKKTFIDQGGNEKPAYAIKEAEKINALKSQNAKIKELRIIISKSEMADNEKADAEKYMIQKIMDGKKITSMKAFAY